MDRRKAFREPIQVPVRFEYGEGSAEGTITDISKDGCTLDSKRRLRAGIFLRIHFPSHAETAPCATIGQIATVRTVNGERAGLKFLAFTPQEQDQLEQTITTTIKKYTAA